MKNKKKGQLFATSVAATLAASAIAPVVAAAATQDFPDVAPTHLYYNTIKDLVAADVVHGYGDGTFRTEGQVTRAEAAVMVTNILKLEKSPTDAPFVDVKAGMWYEGAINALYHAGFIKGVTETTFAPDQTMTRAQLSQLIVTAYEITGKETTLPFEDVKEDAWYESAISKLYSEGLIKGLTLTSFGPEKNIKRGDFAWLLANTDYKFGNTLPKPEVAKIVSVDAIEDITITEGEAVVLPKTVKATYDDKSTKDVDVTWNTDKFDFTKAGSYDLTGTIKDTDKVAQVKVVVEKAPMKATSVTAISKSNVSFTIPATTEAVKDFTIEVKDNTGKVVEVNPVNLVKGETEVTLTFKTALTSDPVGIWTVGGVAFNNDAIKSFNDINAAALDNNEVKTLELLKKAGITNVNDSKITLYVAAINASTTKEKLSDIQKIVNDTNEKEVTADEAAAAVKAVNEAKTQVQLLSALQNKAFARVNADWIVGYDAKINEDNQATVTSIQTLINTVNDTAIADANTKAATVADQNAVTALIKTYQVDDVAPATAKADAIKASEIKAAVFGVNEAKTAASVYDALTKVSTLDSASLPASALNANLKAEYLVAKTASTITGTTTVANIKANIVTIADQAGLAKATTAIVDLTDKSTTADAKSALQKLADVTSHTEDKFDMNTVKEASLPAYLTALVDVNVTNASDVTTIIAAVNGKANEAANLAMIKNTSATTIQVRDALTEIAAGVTANDTTTAYLNASSQVKTEIAQFVIDGRKDLAEELKASDVIVAIGTAHSAQIAQVAKFNTIGNVGAATISSTKLALDNYAYDKYTALSTSGKLAVAEEINKLTKTDLKGVSTALNFNYADKVTTQAQANAYIDAAIAKVSAK